MTATARRMIYWTDEEKRRLAEEGLRLAALFPDATVKRLFDMAMESMPPDRRPTAATMRALPIKRYEFFREPIFAHRAGEARKADTGDTDRIVEGKVDPLDHQEQEQEQEQRRLRMRKWSFEEWRSILDAAWPLYRAMPSASRNHLLAAAVRQVLPKERWPKGMHFSQGARDKFWAGLEARAEAEEGRETSAPPPVPEPPPPVPPLQAVRDAVAPAPEVVYAPREPGTDLRSMLNRMVDSHFDAAAANEHRYDLIQRDVEGMRREVAGLRGLLVRICEALDPNLLDVAAPPPAAPAPEPRPAPPAPILTMPASPAPPPPVEEKLVPPRIRVAVVGILPDQASRVQELVGDLADVRSYEESARAVSVGFAGLDLVLLTRHCRHAAYHKAKNDVGNDRVVRLSSSSVSTAAEEIRKAYARSSRLFLLQQGRNGSQLRGGLG